MEKPRVKKKQMEAIHPYIPEAYEKLEQGRITRRDFIRISTLLGMSAGVATFAAACGTEEEATEVPAEEAAPEDEAQVEEAAPTGGVQRGVPHGFDFWSPFGSMSGPVFQVTEHHLVIADSRLMLARGVDLASSVDTWPTPAWALADGEPDEIVVISMGALARVLESAWPSLEIADLLAGVGDGLLTVHYQEDGFRMSGELRMGSV